MSTDHRGNPTGTNNAAKTNAERVITITGEYGSGSSAKTISGQSTSRTDVYASGNQPGGRDVAGGGSVYSFSAKTRNATPLTSAESRSIRESGQIPDGGRGSKSAQRIMNEATKPYGTTMNTLKSNYKKSRKSGLSPNASRAQALDSDGVISQRILSQDYSGENML